MSTPKEKKVSVQQTQRHEVGQTRGCVIKLRVSVLDIGHSKLVSRGVSFLTSDQTLLRARLATPWPGRSESRAKLFVQETLLPATCLEVHASGRTVTVTEPEGGR